MFFCIERNSIERPQRRPSVRKYVLTRQADAFDRSLIKRRGGDTLQALPLEPIKSLELLLPAKISVPSSSVTEGSFIQSPSRSFLKKIHLSKYFLRVLDQTDA